MKPRPPTPILLMACCWLALAGQAAFAQSAPPVYVLPAVDKAIIVLGDTPGSVHAFQVYRKGPGEREYRLMTPQPVEATADPAEAAGLMGSDYDWIARKTDSIDPEVVWRKLRLDRNLALAYSLLSHGLRRALGRTWIDTETTRGRRYQYRVVLIDGQGNEVQRVERAIRIGDPELPPPPREVTAAYEEGLVTIGWDYPPFGGGSDDRTVGFVVFRRRGSGSFEPLSDAPVLRIEGYLNAFDEKVRTGETYTYGVAAVDIIGAASRRVDAPPLAIEDTAAPLVLVGLKATDRGEDVLLIWKMSPELDVSHYNVYRSLSVDEEAELIRLNPDPLPYDTPRFVDSEAPRGVPLYYRVSAVDRRGNESVLSGPAPVVAEDTEPPAAVRDLEATVDEEERTVRLSWKGPEDPDLAGYYVYSGSDASRLMRLHGKPIQPGGDGVYVDRGYQERGLEPGKSLVYGVSAVDNSYNEGPREVVEVEIPDNVPPDPPSGLAARPTREGPVRLTWQPLLAFDLAGYRVYRSSAASGSSDADSGGGSGAGSTSRKDRRDRRDFEPVAEPGGGITSWLDEEVERGKPVRYYLTAFDESGNESDPSAEVEIVPTDIRPPDPPTELSAEIGRRGVRLSWQPCPDPDVRGYRIYRSEYPGAGPLRPLAVVYDKLEFLDRRGEAGMVYAVSTVDTSGNEGARKEVTTR